MSTAALVLAGGDATRMGGADKPLLEVGGAPMLARIIAALRPDTPAIAISANGDPIRFAPYGLPILPDGAFAGEGPLAGVLAGLDWAAAIGADSLLTIPGDTPFVPAGLAATLAPPPACAASHGRIHHLIALWPTVRRDALRAMLATPGRRAVARFADAIGMRRVAFPAGKWDPFLNVNTPDDLAMARSLVPRAGEGQP
jgi:molybdopterin-guanine dinucleotide biosynthesis protein A